jgi:preflagellin peptidase FlaK
MIIPLAISASAVLLTLVYASFRDLRERRVPFRTWYPMLAIGLPFSTFFYGNYILNLDNTHFSKFYFLIFGLAITLLVIDVLIFLIKESDIPTQKDILESSIFWGVFSIPFGAAITNWVLFNSPIINYEILAICIFCLFIYIFSMTNVMGGADICALIFIAVLIPLFPVTPTWDYSPLFPFPFVVLINALILNLFIPGIIYLINIRKGNYAPFPYMFLGFPVESQDLTNSFGFIMEDVKEMEEGQIQKRYISIRTALKNTISKKNRIYTKDLKQHPEKYTKELALFQKAGTIWISYGVPFIIPITAGLITAIIFGDILFFAMKLLAGV